MINLIKWPATILFVLSIASAMAADLSVNNTDPTCNDAAGAPFCTIGAALGQTLPGDTITVADSTYFGDIVIDKDNLTVRGVGHPTIDGSNMGFSVVSIEASGVRLEGFEVIHGLTGISIGGSQNKVKHDLVHDTFTGIQVGKECCMLSSIETHHVVTRNHVYNNAISGIAVSSSENTIRRNRANKNGEGVIVYGSNNTLTNNRANRNIDGFLISGNHNKIINNVARKNRGSGFSVGAVGQDNELTDNVANENQIGFSEGFVVLNFYTNNSCENNTFFGSVPSGLCGPQP